MNHLAECHFKFNRITVGLNKLSILWILLVVVKTTQSLILMALKNHAIHDGFRSFIIDYDSL